MKRREEFDQPRHVEHAYDHDISLLAYRLQPDHIERLLTGAGLTTTARLVRAAIDPEYTPQAYLMATKELRTTTPPIG